MAAAKKDDEKVDATKAPKAEAVGELVSGLSVSWHGAGWDLPGPTIDDAPATAMVAMEEGKAMVFVREILGQRQWRRFVAKSPTVRDAGEFMELVLREGYGLDLGG